MGQYFRPVLALDEDITVYNRDIIDYNGNVEYTYGKLMEHSYWDNPLLNAISKKLFMNRGRLLWCGEYADDDEIIKTGLSIKGVWYYKGKSIEKTQFIIENLYLCNHDTKEYISMTKYYKNLCSNKHIIHPLSLLTAIGNDRGGGDYRGTNMDYIGKWFWNLISFQQKIPEKYKELEILFIEK